MSALLAGFGLLFLAELGDKTQLLTLSFAARHRALPVLAGVALGEGAAQGIAVIVGGLLGVALPERPLAIGAGVLFGVFAVITWRGDDPEAGTDEPPVSDRRVVLTVGWTIFVGELGDKTLLTSATLATRASPVLTWIGGTLGVTAAGAVAVVVGRQLGRRLPARRIRQAAAAVFALVGAGLIVDATILS